MELVSGPESNDMSQMEEVSYEETSSQLLGAQGP